MIAKQPSIIHHVIMFTVGIHNCTLLISEHEVQGSVTSSDRGYNGNIQAGLTFFRERRHNLRIGQSTLQ